MQFPARMFGMEVLLIHIILIILNVSAARPAAGMRSVRFLEVILQITMELTTVLSIAHIVITMSLVTG